MQLPPSVSLIMILGAAQGFFLAAVLFTRHANSLANRILAVTMVSFSLFILSGAYYVRGWYEVFPHGIGVSESLVYTFGPLLYLYALTLSRGDTRFRKLWLLHFIPFALVALYMVPFFLRSGAYKIDFMEKLLAGEVPMEVRVIDALKYAHGFTYTFLSLLLVHRYGVRLKEDRSSVERINLHWLRNLMLGGLAIWILATIGEFAALLLALFIYAMGYLGLRQPEIFHPRPIAPHGSPGPSSPAAEAEPARYRKSGLDPTTAGAHLEKLLEFMETERPYVQNDLTLQELAAMLEVRPHNLSEIINTRLGKSFYDFVNGYRVAEVKRRLADPSTANLTLLSIALDAGFSSKSTFNEIFKKLVGTTPSDYRNRAQARQA
jgi:AraC-like DNA-binding protein